MTNFTAGICALLIMCSGCSSITKETKNEFPTPKPLIGDDELLNKVQRDVLKYFWDYAELNSGLARERYHTDDPFKDQYVTTVGGSGFGLMTLIAGIERGYIPRAETVNRITKSLEFLKNADRFHGAWPHWLDGRTGKTIPFTPDDNGGDLVETAFMSQALICLREYFKSGNPAEQALARMADELWKGVEWNWYTKGGEHALYWHWSPDKAWKMNFRLDGYNEALIVYILAASSPTHSIPAVAYHQGWARNGNIKSTAKKYGIPVILKHQGTNESVGPLFWAHYSYLGLDPTGLSDDYANYWDVNVNHARIYVKHSILNPGGFRNYSEKLWGLTASYSRNADGSDDYKAHRIDDDNGVISPTAALSSFPYTPKESMMALRYFYEEWNARLIGVCGPYDAFSPQYSWVTPRYLAIDQGTIAPMIENYRSGLFWKLFMNAPEVKSGLKKLNFKSTKYNL